MKKLLYTSLVASSLLMADTDLASLKDQLDKQQQMINQLLSKIEKMESKSAASSYKPTIQVAADENAASSYKTTSSAKSKAFSQSAFIPDISLIGDISYVGRNVKDDELAHLEMPGVAHGIMGAHDHGGHSEKPYNYGKGFNLNYAELGISKAVDQDFNLAGIFHFSEDSVEIEEMFFTTTALGNGLKVKGGKFNSDFGYHNNQHHHYWSFADNALVYEAFLGMHGINEKGLQVQWTAPTDTYFMVGAEVLQGENEQMFGNKSIHLDDLNSTNDRIGASDAPTMYVGYVKSSVDIGDTTVLGGLSYATGTARVDHSTDEEEAHAFSGKSTLYGADLTVKHFFDSYSSLTWQTEYLQRKMEGKKYNIDDTSKAVTSSPNLTKKQSGLYTQLVYAPNKNWKVGARYDTILKNDVIANGTNQNQTENMEKYSGMVEYNTSEFTKLRLQYNQNKALYDEDGKRRDMSSVILQANFAIGAHGAHSF
jgi:hypothetical protein